MSHPLLTLFSGVDEFNATTIAGCVCWTRPLSATMQTDTGAAVSEASRVGYWLDQSGSANDIAWNDSLAVNVCPTFRGGIQNGLPMILFDGVNDFLRSNLLAGYLDGADAATTIAIVFKKTGNVGGDTLWAGGSSTTTTPFNLLQTNAATNYRIYKRDDASSLVAQTGGTPDTSTHVAICRQNGTTVDIWLDGTQIVTAGAFNVGVMTIDNFSLGAWIHTTSQDYLAGYIGEFVMYDSAITDASVSLLRSGLRTRWGV